MKLFQLHIISQSQRGEAMVFIDTFRARILVSSNIFMASTPNILLGKCPPVYIDPRNFSLLNTYFKSTCSLSFSKLEDKGCAFLLKIQRQKEKKLRPLPQQEESL